MSLFNLNCYKSVVLDVHTLLFCILISTTGTIHLNNFEYKFTFSIGKNADSLDGATVVRV